MYVWLYVYLHMYAPQIWMYALCDCPCGMDYVVRSIFAREKMHERFSASAVFQRKIERINTVARHVLL